MDKLEEMRHLASLIQEYLPQAPGRRPLVGAEGSAFNQAVVDDSRWDKDFSLKVKISFETEETQVLKDFLTFLIHRR